MLVGDALGEDEMLGRSDCDSELAGSEDELVIDEDECKGIDV